MADWVLQQWDAGNDRFLIPGPVSGIVISQWFRSQFPDDAAVIVERAVGVQETVPFGGVSALQLAEGDTLVLPGIPVAAGPLLYVMDRLLGPDGCPWDRRQTPDSLIRYLLDESYEAAEALVADDDEAFAEELGDVLLQIAFQGAMLANTSFTDIARRQAQKLVRRHPHVFSDESWDDSDEVRRQWDNLKAQEPQHEGSAVWVYPALAAAKRLSKTGCVPQSIVYQEVLALLQTYFDKAEEKTEDILADAAWAVAQAGGIHHQDAEWALWKKVAETARNRASHRAKRGKKRICGSLGE